MNDDSICDANHEINEAELSVRLTRWRVLDHLETLGLADDDHLRRLLDAWARAVEHRAEACMVDSVLADLERAAPGLGVSADRLMDAALGRPC